MNITPKDEPATKKAKETTNIVLIGGGHAHALVIRQWHKQNIADISLTLISNTEQTPYSGMLPGLISGHYSFDETHINLTDLCRWAKIRFICAKVVKLDKHNKQIHLDNQTNINYDITSINIGSTPNTHQTLGAQEHAIAVKPIATFYPKWLSLQAKISQATKPINIVLVGAGAGGFELITAIHYACKSSSASVQHQLHWVISGDTILPSFSKQVQRKALAYCQRKGINIHCNFSVSQVDEAKIFKKGESSPTQLEFDELIWCTAATPATWPAEAGLMTDEKGFIAINEHLQSFSDENIFAAGDIATQINNPRAKAGVFAVRQAPVLYQNLMRAAQKQPLIHYHPQHKFLSILATGNKEAIACRGRITASGKWPWHLKNYIDKKFMSLCKPTTLDE